MEETIEKIIIWIKKYVEEAGAKGVVIGNSGGKDSATVIALCTKALGKNKVLSVQLPCNSITEDTKDGELVAETFGIKNIKIDITNIYDNLKELTKKAKINLNIDAKVNTKPRLRMTVLYAIAQTYNYLVVGTGNLCESFVGYTTKWGDNANDFNPIANFTTEEVFKMAKILGVPEKIIKKPPNDGLGTGTDEEKLGITYKEISEYIRTGKANPKTKEKIKELHRKTEHKRNPIPKYIP